MFKSFKYRRNVSFFLGSTFFILIAIGASVLLGSFYIKILTNGSKTDNNITTKEVSSVLSEAKNKKIVVKMDSYPVYFLQAGVFSDLEGARKSAEELKTKGLIAFPSRVSPFKVVLAVYSNRDAAYEAKKELDGKNISSYISSSVINGKDMLIPKQKELKDTEKVLRGINDYFIYNFTLWDKKFENVEEKNLKDKLNKSTVIYNEIENGFINKNKAPEWFKYIAKYQKNIEDLKDNWTINNYNNSRIKLTEAICEYINWTQGYIENQ